MAKRFERVTIRSITALNRVTILPMCMNRRKTALQMTFTLFTAASSQALV